MSEESSAQISPLWFLQLFFNCQLEGVEYAPVNRDWCQLSSTYGNVADIELVDEEVEGPNRQKRIRENWRRTQSAEAGESSRQAEKMPTSLAPSKL